MTTFEENEETVVLVKREELKTDIGTPWTCTLSKGKKFYTDYVSFVVCFEYYRDPVSIPSPSGTCRPRHNRDHPPYSDDLVSS